MKPATIELLEKADENSFRERQTADYHHNAEFSEADAVTTINHAEEFLTAAKSYLVSTAPPTS